MMEIRSTYEDAKIFKKFPIPERCTLTIDNSIGESVIMVHSNGRFECWTRGMENIKSFLRFGYVRIIKNCPHRFGKCIGEKCSLYVIRNGTGDCAHVWNAVLKEV